MEDFYRPVWLFSPDSTGQYNLNIIMYTHVVGFFCSSLHHYGWEFLFLKLILMLISLILVGWIRNILSAWWFVSIHWNPWQYTEFWSCSRSSSWRSHVWSLMVWPRWSMWVGDFSQRCWIYLWSGNLRRQPTILHLTLDIFTRVFFSFFCCFSRTYPSSSTIVII